jgi:serine phosphatase RsbU (regulator of sigma subunit)
MKKFSLLIIIVLALPCCAQCRDIKFDSIWNALRHEKEDTTKVKTLNTMAEVYSQHASYNTADSLAKAALALAEKCNYKKGIAIAYNHLAAITLDRGNSKEAIEYELLSLKAAEDINDKGLTRNAYGGLGNIYRVFANYSEALKNYMLSLQLDTEMHSTWGIAADYGNLGIVSCDIGNYPSALDYQLKCLKLREELQDKHGIAGCYGNIGNIYSFLNNTDEALRYFLLCLKISEELSDELSISNCYFSIADIYMSKEDYAKALDYNRKSLALDSAMGAKDGLAADYDNISSVYLNMEKNDEAIKYAQISIKLSKETGDVRVMVGSYGNIQSALFKEGKYLQSKTYMDSALNLAKKAGLKNSLAELNRAYSLIDSTLGDYSSAFSHYKTYIAYQDSIKNEANTKKLVEEQMTFDFQKKEAGAKAEQEKKDTIADADKRKQGIITVFISLGLLIVLAFSGLLFSRFRVTQKQKKIIEEQKQIVEEKNKEVLDSITYAKRLQDAILPPLSTIKKQLPGSFILYKPKDIVAGDFYWMETSGDNILIAAADCTGHGVPGAMVSVVCSNALNRAVKEFHLTSPGGILDKTRELVLETFEKSEGDIKDGMDISLCSIDNKTKEIKWAGAYNPLWYVHNGEMNDVSANKQPIGKNDSPLPFDTKSIKLDKGDIFYLFTDGFADQFGGPKGKKFKYKQLQQLLLSIAHKPIEEQYKTVETCFEDWKVGLEQTDDVCLIAIKV